MTLAASMPLAALRAGLFEPGPRRALWRIAGPLMLSNVMIAMLGLVDMGLVGHMNDSSFIAGVAIGAVLFDYLYWGANFLRMGTTGLTAQERGAGNAARLRGVLLESLVVAFGLGLVMLLARDLLLEIGFALVVPSPAAAAHAQTYFELKLWGAPAVLGQLALVGWLIGLQNARAALALTVFAAVVNAALDAFMVLGLGLGVFGLGLGAALSAYLGLAFGLVLAWRELGRHPSSSSARWSPAHLLALIHVNGNIALRTFCLIFTFSFFTRQGALQGDVILAANAILLQFQILMALAVDGFANALEALVGDAIGARRRDRFVLAVASGTAWSGILALGFALAYGLGGTALIALLTDLVAVRATAGEYLWWAAVSPVISAWCFVLDGIFVGAMRAREMRDTMLAATFAVFLPAWYLLQPLGNHGLWASFVLFFAARGVLMTRVFVALDRVGGFVAGPVSRPATS